MAKKKLTDIDAMKQIDELFQKINDPNERDGILAWAIIKHGTRLNVSIDRKPKAASNKPSKADLERFRKVAQKKLRDDKQARINAMRQFGLKPDEDSEAKEDKQKEN